MRGSHIVRRSVRRSIGVEVRKFYAAPEMIDIRENTKAMPRSVVKKNVMTAAGMVVCALLAAAQPAAAEDKKAGQSQAAPAAEITLDVFLDRLMMSESGGRLNARNSRSTALGPYQFIASTWLHIARTSFATETAELKPHEVLELRTDLTFARRAAKIYTEANAAHLAANSHKPTFANLRLAFLVGPSGAVKILSAKPETPVVSLLGTTVVGANPFMRSMTAADLVARAARDISADIAVDTGLTPSPDAIANAKGPAKYAGPSVAVKCSLARPSCRRWLALANRKGVRNKRISRN